MTNASLSELKAIASQVEQDPRAARKALRRLAPDLPQTAPVQTALGMTYISLDQPRDAMRAFKRAIELDAVDPVPRYQLGVLQSDQGLLPQAEENLRVAVEATPDDPDYLSALGFNYYRAGKNDQAVETLERALAAGAENENAFIALGYLYYEADRLDDSRDAFARILDLDPDRGDVYNNMGYIDILRGELQEAEQELTTCLEKDDAYLRARYNLALIAWLQSEQEKAIELYKEARRNDRGDAELQQHIADLDEVATHYDEDKQLTALENKLIVAVKTGRLK
jgi:Flp pilus assembly protein TadD